MLVMIEGIDGTGKTSLISELKTRDRFSEAMFVPTPSTVIRDSVLGYNIDPVAKFFFFLGDMVDIRKALEEESAKRVVFLDRFFDTVWSCFYCIVNFVFVFSFEKIVYRICKDSISFYLFSIHFDSFYQQ